MKQSKTASDLKSFAHAFADQFRQRITGLIGQDEYGPKTAIIAGEINYEGENRCLIPLVLRNSELYFDLFTYVIILDKAASSHLVVSIQYLNQNIIDNTDFGLLRPADQETMLATLANDLMHRFNASKGDFTRTAR